MGRQSKSTAKPNGGDLFIAQVDGSIAKHRPPKPPKTELGPFKKSRIKSVRQLNAFCYALAAIIVLFSVSTSSWDGYDSYQDGMSNQTLLSVAPYAQCMWYALYFLQGLFVAASYIPSLWSSEYLGYTALNHTRTGWRAFKKSIPVEHFPVLCASTAIAVYSFFKMNNMGLALACSCASTFFLIVIIRYQLTVTPPAPATYEENFRGGIKGWFRRRRVDEESLNEQLTHREFTNQIQQYIFLKLPFELYAGYNIAWSVSIVGIMVHRAITSTFVDVVLACVSLVALLGVGCYVMWSEKKGMFYGVGAGLAWYLFGVFFELVYPSSSVVYTTYSDAAIAVTKYMAVSFASLFVAAVVVRAIKYVMKGGFHEEDSEEDEDDVRKIVLHSIAAVESGGKHMIHEAEGGVDHVSTDVLPAVVKAVETTSRRGIQAVEDTSRRGIQAVEETKRRIIEEAEESVDNISVVIDEALDEAEEGVESVFEALGV